MSELADWSKLHNERTFGGQNVRRGFGVRMGWSGGGGGMMWLRLECRAPPNCGCLTRRTGRVFQFTMHATFRQGTGSHLM